MDDSRPAAEDDESKIRAAALDYIGGVLEADPARMERVASTPTWPSGPTSRAWTASRNYPRSRR